MQICVQTLWCCLQAVWILPLTTVCSTICVRPLQGVLRPVWTGPKPASRSLSRTHHVKHIAELSPKPTQADESVGGGGADSEVWNLTPKAAKVPTKFGMRTVEMVVAGFFADQSVFWAMKEFPISAFPPRAFLPCTRSCTSFGWPVFLNSLRETNSAVVLPSSAPKFHGPLVSGHTGVRVQNRISARTRIYWFGFDNSHKNPHFGAELRKQNQQTFSSPQQKVCVSYLLTGAIRKKNCTGISPTRSSNVFWACSLGKSLVE